MVHATRARQEAHTRWPTFLLWKPVVSIDNTVSTSIRVFQVPRGQTFMLGGSPVLAWNPVSVRMSSVRQTGPSGAETRGVDVGGGAVPGTDQAPLVHDKQSLPPTIHR